MQQTFLCISSLSLHDYDVKHPNFTYYGGRVAKLRYGPLVFNSKKFETARIHSLSDVSLPSPSSVTSALKWIYVTIGNCFTNFYSLLKGQLSLLQVTSTSSVLNLREKNYFQNVQQKEASITVRTGRSGLFDQDRQKLITWFITEWQAYSGGRGKLLIAF